MRGAGARPEMSSYILMALLLIRHVLAEGSRRPAEVLEILFRLEWARFSGAPKRPLAERSQHEVMCGGKEEHVQAEAGNRRRPRRKTAGGRWQWENTAAQAK